ncbi:hypothetical protein GCM10023328_02160 [Modestobacter marinus]|uniref:Uncharacterized protein n=1 Tax=Modestobacter marinus TaxID=477641 RepID=A0ABQ2FUA0_9ACTN|nr:hypothetical protein GCM10011589_07800 [Modestobacter marinus]
MVAVFNAPIGDALAVLLVSLQIEVIYRLFDGWAGSKDAAMLTGSHAL